MKSPQLNRKRGARSKSGRWHFFAPRAAHKCPDCGMDMMPIYVRDRASTKRNIRIGVWICMGCEQLWKLYWKKLSERGRRIG